MTARHCLAVCLCGSRCCYRDVSPHRRRFLGWYHEEKATLFVEPLPYIGSSLARPRCQLFVSGAANFESNGYWHQQQEFSFGDYPTTSPARQRRGRDGPGAGARRRRSRDSPPAQAAAGRAGVAARAVAVRRRQIPGRLQALRLRQSGCARRAAPPVRSRSGRLTISTSWSPASRARSRPASSSIYESLMTQSLDEVSTEYGALGRSRQPSRGFLLGHLSAARGGEMA